MEPCQGLRNNKALRPTKRLRDGQIGGWSYRCGTTEKEFQPRSTRAVTNTNSASKLDAIRMVSLGHQSCKYTVLTNRRRSYCAQQRTVFVPRRFHRCRCWRGSWSRCQRMSISSRRHHHYHDDSIGEIFLQQKIALTQHSL